MRTSLSNNSIELIFYSKPRPRQIQTTPDFYGNQRLQQGTLPNSKKTPKLPIRAFNDHSYQSNLLDNSKEDSKFVDNINSTILMSQTNAQSHKSLAGSSSKCSAFENTVSGFMQDQQELQKCNYNRDHLRVLNEIKWEISQDKNTKKISDEIRKDTCISSKKRTTEGRFLFSFLSAFKDKTQRHILFDIPQKSKIKSIGGIESKELLSSALIVLKNTLQASKCKPKNQAALFLKKKMNNLKHKCRISGLILLRSLVARKMKSCLDDLCHSY